MLGLGLGTVILSILRRRNTTPPDVGGNFLLLSDGTSRLLLSDGTSFLVLR